MPATAMNTKFMSTFHKQNSWRDLVEASQEWSVLSLDVHIAGMFRFAAQDGC
jgi:hypothetical protein